MGGGGGGDGVGSAYELLLFPLDRLVGLGVNITNDNSIMRVHLPVVSRIIFPPTILSSPRPLPLV